MTTRSYCSRVPWFTAIPLCAVFLTTPLIADDVGLSVPEGFEATLFADDDLAHDIYSLTIDARGRVVVSGAGYVRILVDDDDDGRADRAIEFADAPRNGAQGMFFDGRDLLCTGDEGLLRLSDTDGDDRADGPPAVLWRVKTGGEHDAHSIQPAPDGSWVVIAGNNAGVSRGDATDVTSPILHPNAGTVVRFSPDFRRREIVADGFRNAYDFAFNSRAELFVFDSDGERDVSLPWYRPTRVFHAVPGSNAGWFSRSWKRPDVFWDMPPVIAALGRGSPTGVACYRHDQFPTLYRDAVLVADWTFGRVVAIIESPDGRAPRQSIDLVTGAGRYGFAPTDLAIGPDGSLLVSVGGRGTRGGVFRIRWTGAARTRRRTSDPLRQCLGAPQPLSSWSRAAWIPAARRIGAAKFRAAATDTQLARPLRLRAIEILVHLFDGLGPSEWKNLAEDSDPVVRAHTAWALGRALDPGGVARLDRFMRDPDPRVARAALESLIGHHGDDEFDRLSAAFARCLSSDDQRVWSAAQRVLSRAAEDTADTRPTPSSPVRVDQNISLRNVRTLQLQLGDVGPGGTGAAVFDGYRVPGVSPPESRRRVLVEQLESVYPTGHATVDYELARVVSMLNPNSPFLLERVLAQVTTESHPVDDLHHLIVAARITAPRSAEVSRQTANGLIRIEAKLDERRMNRDSNWDVRVGELVEALATMDERLLHAIVSHSDFGHPGHVLFVEKMNRVDRQTAIAKFSARISAEPEMIWSADLVRLLGRSNESSVREQIRLQLDNLGLRDAVLGVLAREPEPGDRARFASGLSSASLETLALCLRALETLPNDEHRDEAVALVLALRRWDTDRKEYELRERVVRLLRRRFGRQFGFQFGPAGHERQEHAVGRWTAFIVERYPDSRATLAQTPRVDLERLLSRLESVPWDQGDRARGQRLFEKRACGQCHGGRRAFGPDLAGVARRFSRTDLFTAIGFPSRDVSPRYQTTVIQTRDGQVFTGMVIYESVDGVTLRSATETLRIEADEIQQRRTSTVSLMPQGLLDSLTKSDLADLDAYLRAVSE